MPDVALVCTVTGTCLLCTSEEDGVRLGKLCALMVSIHVLGGRSAQFTVRLSSTNVVSVSYSPALQLLAAVVSSTETCGLLISRAILSALRSKAGLGAALVTIVREDEVNSAAGVHSYTVHDELAAGDDAAVSASTCALLEVFSRKYVRPLLEIAPLPYLDEVAAMPSVYKHGVLLVDPGAADPVLLQHNTPSLGEAAWFIGPRHDKTWTCVHAAMMLCLASEEDADAVEVPLHGSVCVLVHRVQLDDKPAFLVAYYDAHQSADASRPIAISPNPVPGHVKRASTSLPPGLRVAMQASGETLGLLFRGALPSVTSTSGESTTGNRPRVGISAILPPLGKT